MRGAGRRGAHSAGLHLYEPSRRGRSTQTHSVLAVARALVGGEELSRLSGRGSSWGGEKVLELSGSTPLPLHP